MPESEPKPKLIELVGPGGGQGWKAVLKSRKPAVVHEIPIPQAEAAAAVPRLQRLYDHRHPALSPVLAWGTDQQGVWVAVEPNEGTSLGSILSRGPLTPPAAAALGTAVLSGVAALHEAGIAMGGFGATAVRVTSNGEVRIAGHPAAAPYIAPPRREDAPVRSPASYDAPDRPLQTYPPMPAVTFPPAPAAPPAPAVPVAPAASTPGVPTWSEAPAAPQSPFEAPAAGETNPPAPAPVEPPKPAEPEPPPPARSRETAAPAAPSAAPVPAPASAFGTSPPAPSAPAPPAPVPSPSPQETWSPVEAPVWKP